jgi:hypothetical protein
MAKLIAKTRSKNYINVAIRAAHIGLPLLHRATKLEHQMRRMPAQTRFRKLSNSPRPAMRIL